MLPRPLPVLCIDEVHNVSSGAMKESGKQAALARLLRWALFLTDAQLAHVVFVARTSAALELDDLVASFRARRQRVLVDFAPAGAVSAYLHDEHGLSSDHAHHVATTIGTSRSYGASSLP